MLEQRNEEEIIFPCSLCEEKEADFFFVSKYTGHLVGLCLDCNSKVKESDNPDLFVHSEIAKRQ